MASVAVSGAVEPVVPPLFTSPNNVVQLLLPLVELMQAARILARVMIVCCRVIPLASPVAWAIPPRLARLPAFPTAFFRPAVLVEDEEMSVASVAKPASAYA